jgi:hypothetical protein
MKMLRFLPRCTLQRHVAEALRASPLHQGPSSSNTVNVLQFAQFTRSQVVLVDADPLNFADVRSLVKLLHQEQSHISLFFLGAASTWNNVWACLKLGWIVL